ncbi:NEDD8 ultimate buster 1 [Citrus sinensis]|uniref:NEDD8 ultimate buster 1 n=1 Tax=Citrus sinensis TaxID=2711 RepID=A0ACB8P4P3_CITSI|nr:NEDD8 ultimate buster 1 [Citrus sinensis]
MAKLKIAGTWSGVLEVELESWTVPMLREEVAKRSNMLPETINLICAGKVLKDDHGGGCDSKLSQLGVKNNSKVLATRISVDEGKSLMAEEERSRRVARIKAAATALVNRHADGSLPVEDFNLELEDQNGEKVRFGSETDRRAMMMGLMLHANAKSLIKRQMYKDALEVLTMGEFVDNVPLLQIDMVWCYFMLRDISWLSEAGIRLRKAREGIERAHGKDSSRVRLLQAGRHPELALHLRMELLEAVAAYHSGQFDKARNALTSAQAKFFQLQVPDESLSLVMSMGFKEQDAKRALRICSQDVGSAIDFLVEEKAKRAKEREDNEQRRKEIMEQKRYGLTPLKKAVDIEKIKELVSIGFEKELVAEALRRNENDSQKALDDLTNPESNSAIQLYIESRKRKRCRQAADAKIEQLVAMGFERPRVIEACRAGGDDIHQIMLQLLGEPGSNPTAAANNNASTSISMPNNGEPSSSINNENVEGDPDSSFEETSATEDVNGRDVEMEDELANDLTGDVFADYDIEVTKEGEAISEYLSLLDSVAGIAIEKARN